MPRPKQKVIIYNTGVELKTRGLNYNRECSDNGLLKNKPDEYKRCPACGKAVKINSTKSHRMRKPNDMLVCPENEE